MNCKKCGNEIDTKAVICPNCGCKVKKPILKKWWFWTIIVIIFISIVSSVGGNEETTTDTQLSQSTNVSENKTKQYEKIELQTMIDDLKSNALKAEKTYKSKYVEITGKITTFDSDGSYISIESTTAGDFNLDTVTCKIKNDTQLNTLLEKSTGDTVTIKGKVVSVGEILGYTVNIEEVL